jgi:Fe-S-cluster-containing dehydrogenase component
MRCSWALSSIKKNASNVMDVKWPAKHCIEPACAGVCPTGAISKRDTDGAVLVDKALCIGCRACLDACPYNVPQFGTDGLMQKCDMCLGEETNTLRIKPPCVSTCPTGALDIKTMVPQQKNDLDTEISRLYQMIQPL